MKVTTNLSSNSSQVELDSSEKHIDYGVRTRKSRLKFITSNIECGEALILAIEPTIIHSKLVRIFQYMYIYIYICLCFFMS